MSDELTSELPARHEHAPIEMNVQDVACATGSCGYLAGRCATIGRVIACDACTYDGLDTGLTDAVEPYPWPCPHASEGTQ